ncbi:fumarate hydratase [uncultured Draconibacterium sp.]|uniref:fumarate hydratase n=1 Tax=uncultured Draconibacterium sp. TaxID=1573823 RepID=UPI0025DB605E|nr:fumarate hydratase [uncultured Draconibacterium sp.]
MSYKSTEIINKVKETLISAGSTFSDDKKEIYRQAIEKESQPVAKWVLENTLKNALAAEINRSPLCDDSGIPHLFLEVGPNSEVSGQLIADIHMGIYQGLNALPGRPMAIMGNDFERIDQSGGLNVDPGAMLPSPLIIKPTKEDVLRLHVLMHGGGPEIRGKTFRVFHKHSVSVVTDEIIDWTVEAAGKLGCSPITLAVGIGRSHFEASTLMFEAMVFGKHSIQSDIEKDITSRVNKSNIGSLGLGGDITALSTFLKVGPQRASGVRIVSMRPCCSIEPRKASVVL